MHTPQQKIIRLGLMLVLIAALATLFGIALWHSAPDTADRRDVAHITAYLNALELARIDDGHYPGERRLVCLGDYADNACWDKGGTGVEESPQVNEVLARYLPSLPKGGMVESAVAAEEGREGYVYRAFANGTRYEINYLRAGEGADCMEGALPIADLAVRATPFHGNTWCRIVR